jgi:2-polyprenyl-6-methoxyphenol hydroxylase-like FAD-dependent oxidoreductase
MSEGRHAVVIGGSVGGLCAARVLAEHFDRVTVVDRDTFPEGAEYRKGVPQSRHPHALLDGGRRELERLFPGFERMLLGAGAHELNPGLDFAMLQPNGWLSRRGSPFTLIFCSRVLLESVVRDRASRLPGIRFLEETEVTGLLSARQPHLRATGVEIRSRGGGEREEIHADLIIDASGRSTRVPEWLEQLGLAAVQTTVVDADAAYSTRWYRAPADWPSNWWWRCIWIEPLLEGASRPEEQYFGVLFPVEGDRWIVTTASWGGRELPRDPEAFERLISKLRSPILHEALARAEPISDVYRRRALQNSYRHYERWGAELPGFIATADAVCAFNPVYGQGMTSAALCAGVLERTLERVDPSSPRFPREFFRAQSRFLDRPWAIAVSRDLEHPRTTGGASMRGALRRIAGRLGKRYMLLVAMASSEDEAVRERLFHVINLTRPPGALVSDPRFILRVLRGARRFRARVGAAGPAPDWPPREQGVA